MTEFSRPFVKKLQVRNFRSIIDASVVFDNPMFLVGRNGAGKSGFVDVLSFVADCMSAPIHSVFQKRRGLGYVVTRYRSTPVHRPPLQIRIDFTLPGDSAKSGFYAFSLADSLMSWFVVDKEVLVLREEGELVASFDRGIDNDGVTYFRSNVEGLNLRLDPQSLALPLVGAIESFSDVVKSLSSMRVYQINPENLRGVEDESAPSYLDPEGRGAATVLNRLTMQQPDIASRIQELLAGIDNDVSTVNPVRLRDGKLIISVEEKGKLFDTASLSDGTLRSLGNILALNQYPLPPLIVIEEPELHIHPGVLDAVSEVIRTAAKRTQVIVTTHSPDLLDAEWIRPENLRVVVWEEDGTRVAPLGSAPTKLLRQHLNGAGDLLRSNMLDEAPDTSDEPKGDLFEAVPA
jgi:predicted ATPase